MYLGAILMPLLGLFNAITYFWPRYIAHKDTNPNDGILARWANVFNVYLADLGERTTVLSDGVSKGLSKFRGRSTNNNDASDRTGDDLSSPLFQDNAKSNDGQL